MNDKVNEQISAWVDGELPERELDLLLVRVAGDRSLGQRWARYHLIRSTRGSRTGSRRRSPRMPPYPVPRPRGSGAS